VAIRDREKPVSETEGLPVERSSGSGTVPSSASSGAAAEPSREEDDRAREHGLLAERLAAVDTLVAGLAHEINNPLTYTLINVEHVLRRMRVLASVPPSPEAVEMLAEAMPSVVESLSQTLQGVHRVREVVRNLMTFSRGGVESTALVDVRGVAEASIQMAPHELVHRARIVRDLGEVAPVLASEASIGQVFLGLIVNAAQSIPEGDPQHHEIRIRTRTEANDVIVEVSDTGVGIPPEVLPRIFDPFFTSKRTGEGPGLGLSVCYGTVKRLGGDIDVTSVAGRGTTFRVALPQARGHALSAPKASERASEPKARVLVVDEDELTSEGLARALEDVADVSIAGSGKELLERLVQGQRWDAVLCDLSMAEMSGMDVYSETLRTAPDAAGRIVFMTTGALSPYARTFLESIGNACLEKPFDVSSVRSVIARTARE
jgi:signal transduction histidine kinase/ActR/RegA family two-component response regulator